MASANEPGNLRIVAITPQGIEVEVAQYRSDGPVSAGKSPDGVLANLTIDKQMFMQLCGPVLGDGWKIGLRFKMDAADGLDASDCVIMLPITRDDNSPRTLNATDLGFSTDLPAATPAGVWLPLGSDFGIPVGTRWKIGGGPVVISIEDDTA